MVRTRAKRSDEEPGPSKRNTARKTSHNKTDLAKSVREAVTKKPKKKLILPKPPTGSGKKKKKFTGKRPVARKSTARPVERLRRAPENFNEDAEWELEEFGGMYLAWGKKKVRQPDGSTITEAYLKGDTEHRIWIKWTVAFSDGIRWSAEKQDKLVGVDKKKIKEIVNAREAWPLPSIKDGRRSLWKARKLICQGFGITEWQPASSKPNDKWQIIDPELPTTTSEVDDTDEETDDDEA
ncbi:Oidioi.mRNA.OKI2018_I69.XSR.g14089.t1.cds [Oikopleura dioica]|uniref:Oidioi.mRNA.OKI2018_I69.XSR.g14089.t1.cds n=1 Tax=Oikopleura dioica TaxID=34765 RepID=A0ABN7SCT8_OIKDI|nr:Oidioi.mRNA.OKI2018_I69.XSR.g14089.t1.cds [Oikopleura dioica]